MKDIKEIKKSIQLLGRYPHTFVWVEFGDKGNACIGRLDHMDRADNDNYAETYAAVVKAMPKYSELHECFGAVLQKELGLAQYPRYDYEVKLLTRIFMDDAQMQDSDSVKRMCFFTDRVQRYMKTTGKKKLEPADMAPILG